MKSFLQALLLTSVCVSTIAASDNVLFLNESATIPMMQIRTPDAPRKARALNAGDVASSGSDFNQGNSDTDDAARRLDFSDSESNPGDQSSEVVIRGLDFSDLESRNDELFTGINIITPRPYAVAEQNRPGPSHARLGIVQHSDSEIETAEPATPINRRFSSFSIRLSQNILDLTSNTDNHSNRHFVPFSLTNRREELNSRYTPVSQIYTDNHSNRHFVPLPQHSSDSESESDQAITDTSEVDSDLGFLDLDPNDDVVLTPLDLSDLGLVSNDFTTPREQIIPVQNLSNTDSDQEYSYSDRSGYNYLQPHNTLNLINFIPVRGNLRLNLSSKSSIHQGARS
jgi:hypothetical protein